MEPTSHDTTQDLMDCTGLTNGKQPTRDGCFISDGETVSFLPFYADKNEIQNALTIEVIAHSLAHQCRFNGMTPIYYSLAQHSIRVAEMGVLDNLPAPEVMGLLLHDVAETLIGDIIRPVKNRMKEACSFLKHRPDMYADERTRPCFKAAWELSGFENRVERAIMDKYGAKLPINWKHYDNLVNKQEVEYFFEDNYTDEEGFYRELSFAEIKREFLRMFLYCSQGVLKEHVGEALKKDILHMFASTETTAITSIDNMAYTFLKTLFGVRRNDERNTNERRNDDGENK